MQSNNKPPQKYRLIFDVILFHAYLRPKYQIFDLLRGIKKKINI